jgi:N6-adenosine-specific RNA methylase IME4
VTRYRLVVADPPWKHSDQLPGEGRGAGKHYDLLSASEIAAYPLPPVADDAILLLWRVASMQAEALSVAAAWGFVPRTELVWVKTTTEGKLAFGMGRYFRGSHETCLVATRGKAASLVVDHSLKSVFFAPRTEHSAKPEAFFRIAERLCLGPRVELFARGAPRAGWDRFGREAAGEPERPAESTRA